MQLPQRRRTCKEVLLAVVRAQHDRCLLRFLLLFLLLPPVDTVVGGSRRGGGQAREHQPARAVPPLRRPRPTSQDPSHAAPAPRTNINASCCAIAASPTLSVLSSRSSSIGSGKVQPTFVEALLPPAGAPKRCGGGALPRRQHSPGKMDRTGCGSGERQVPRLRLRQRDSRRSGQGSATTAGARQCARPRQSRQFIKKRLTSSTRSGPLPMGQQDSVVHRCGAAAGRLVA